MPRVGNWRHSSASVSQFFSTRASMSLTESRLPLTSRHIQAIGASAEPQAADRAYLRAARLGSRCGCHRLLADASSAPTRSRSHAAWKGRPYSPRSSGRTRRSQLGARRAHDQAFAACGDKGGPGYRSASGRCVGWADIGKTCGNPPSTKCTAENTASGAETAADLGQKAWDAGRDARKAAGRSD
jgi:hypothetical protein